MTSTLWPEDGQARPKHVVTITVINTKPRQLCFWQTPLPSFNSVNQVRLPDGDWIVLYSPPSSAANAAVSLSQRHLSMPEHFLFVLCNRRPTNTSRQTQRDTNYIVVNTANHDGRMSHLRGRVFIEHAQHRPGTCTITLSNHIAYWRISCLIARGSFAMRVRLLHYNGASLSTWASSKTMCRMVHVIVACFVHLHT
jgi:hypothetical protein